MTAPTPLQAYVEANAAFWDAHVPPSSGGGTILVDLMHDNQWYLRWNLLTAKYLQMIHGGSIWGLLHHWQTPLLEYDPNINRDLAVSFGVDRVLDLDERRRALEASPGPQEQRKMAAFEAQLSQLEGLEHTALRQALLALAPDGDPDFGWLAYDTHLRSKRMATVHRWDESSQAAFIDLYWWKLLCQRMADTQRFSRCVVGHIEYAPYAFFAQAAIEAGGEAYFLWPLVPGTLRVFRDRESLRLNRDANFVDFYESQIASKIAVDAPQVQRFWQGFRSRFAATRAYQRDNQRSSAQFDRATFLGSLGLDPNKRSVCLLSQALSDAVHANGPMIFDDFGDWIVRSVDHAAMSGNFNLMVKIHPRDRVYSRDGFVADLVRQYDHAPNISILTRTVENAEIIAHCDAVSTVHGTPGYEFTMMGAHSILAGAARYSGLGVCAEPATRDDYFEALGRVSPTAGEREDAQRKALVFAFAEFCVMRAPTLFVRRDKVRVKASDRFWREEALVVSTTTIEDDPFYHCVLQMAHGDHVHLCRHVHLGG